MLLSLPYPAAARNTSHLLVGQGPVVAVQCISLRMCQATCVQWRNEAMRFRLTIPVALGLLTAAPVFAQRPEEHHEGPRANHGRVPEGPPPKRDVHAKPEVERHDGRVNSIPHVSNDHWYGHDRANDKRYVV